MNPKYNLPSIINRQDRTAAIVIARGTANNALGRAVFLAMAIIRQREVDTTAEEAHDNLIGRDLSALLKQSQNREPPVGLEPRKSLEERLHEAGKVYTFGEHICQENQETEFDIPQDVPSRVVWQIRQLHAQSKAPLVADRTSLASMALANQPRERAKADLEFMQQHGAEIVGLVDGVFRTVATDEAINYVDTCTGLERYQLLVVATDACARQLARKHATIAKLRPGSPLTRTIASEMGVIEGAWKECRKATIDLEVEDARALLDVIDSGRQFRDLAQSDKLLTDLGVDIDAACAK